VKGVRKKKVEERGKREVQMEKGGVESRNRRFKL
jgi:hypothetical protein